MLPALLRRSLSRRAVVAGVVVLMALSAGVSWKMFHGADIELDIATATARRPLVVQNGKVTQMPSGDYLAADTLVDTTGCSSTNVIAWNGSQFACAVAAGGGISGLTTGTISKATTSTSIGNSNITESGTVDTFTGDVAMLGYLHPTSIGPFTLGTTQNNYNPTGFAHAMTVLGLPTANIHITGFAAQADGYEFTFLNSDILGWTITFDQESASSTITNRLEMPDQQDGWAMFAGCSARFRYNASIGATTPGRWQVLAWSCDGAPRLTATGTALNNSFTGNLSVGGTVTTPSFQTSSTTTSFLGHVRGAGSSVTLTNATCSSTRCDDTAGTVTTSSTSMTVTFASTFTGADDATCILQEMGGTVVPTFTTSATALTATVVVNAAKYHYICVGH